MTDERPEEQPAGDAPKAAAAGEKPAAERQPKSLLTGHAHLKERRKRRKRSKFSIWAALGMAIFTMIGAIGFATAKPGWDYLALAVGLAGIAVTIFLNNRAFEGLSMIDPPFVKGERVRRTEEQRRARLGVDADITPELTPEFCEAVLIEASKPGSLGSTWVSRAAILAISLVLFFGLGLMSAPLTILLTLAVVLFVHELGHYAAMRVFRYRNVGMLFIPLFGAATYGTPSCVPGYRKAIVVLLGPLPGMVIGVALLVGSVFIDLPTMRIAGAVFLGLNILNLLPVQPLDGGRFLETVLFSRSRVAELLFNLVAVAGLAVLAVYLRAWFLGLLALVVLVRTKLTDTGYTLAATLRKEIEIPEGSTLEEMPPEDLKKAAGIVFRNWKEKRNRDPEPKVVGRWLAMAWEKLHARPPGALATAALMLVYLVSLSPLIVVAGVVLAFRTEVVAFRKADGTQGRKEVRRFGWKLFHETEIDKDGLYHGRHVEYNLLESGIDNEGNWTHGRRDGEFKDYWLDGTIKDITVYENGRFVLRKIPTAKGWIEKKPEDMFPEFRLWAKRQKNAPPQGIGRMVPDPGPPREPSPEE